MANFFTTFFTNSEIPAWLSLVAVTFVFLYLRQDIKAIKEFFGKDVKSIKENLNNHVTDTNKKIDDLRKDMKEQFNKINSKIDQLKTDMHNSFNTMMLAVIGLPHKKNESDSKRNN